jgi:hypothetical protein
MVDVTDGAALPVFGSMGQPQRDDYRVRLSFAGRSYELSFRPTPPTRRPKPAPAAGPCCRPACC